MWRHNSYDLATLGHRERDYVFLLMTPVNERPVYPQGAMQLLGRSSLLQRIPKVKP